MTNNSHFDPYSAQTTEAELKTTPTEIDGYVGLIAMEFNNLELGLQFVLSAAGEMHQRAGALIWHSVMWNARLEIMDKLFLSWPQLRPYWVKLLELLREVAADRNFVVHGERSGTGGQACIVSPDTFLNPDLGRRTDKLSIGELKEIILDIDAAKHATNMLHHWMMGITPLPDTFPQVAIRRRPPRSLRRNPNNSAHEGPPQSSQA